MKNSMTRVLIMVGGLAAASCMIGKADAPAKSRLQYFGYWPGSVSAGGSVDEQKDHVNFTFAVGFGWNDNAKEEQGDAGPALAAGMKLLMQAPDPDDPHWNDWAAKIEPIRGSIFAFFTMDEPDCQCGGDLAKLDQLLNKVAQEARMVKNRFPGARAMMTVGCIEGIGRGNPHYRIPAEIDYLALEAYQTKAVWLDHLAILRTYMNSSQKLFLMPGATIGYGKESELIQKANDVYEYAKTDPQVIGVFPFDWYGGDKNEPGVRDLPNLRARYTQIGKEIIGGATPSTPKMPHR